MRFGVLEIINKNFMNLEEIISIVNLKRLMTIDLRVKIITLPGEQFLGDKH
jgi:hypothetical protein